jgi:hypothetical protein
MPGAAGQSSSGGLFLPEIQSTGRENIWAGDEQEDHSTGSTHADWMLRVPVCQISGCCSSTTTL